MEENKVTDELWIDGDHSCSGDICTAPVCTEVVFKVDGSIVSSSCLSRFCIKVESDCDNCNMEKLSGSGYEGTCRGNPVRHLSVFRNT